VLSNLLAAKLTMNTMGESNFNNLDSWLPKSRFIEVYEEKICNVILKKKEEPKPQ
jgi:hypothetical protein